MMMNMTIGVDDVLLWECVECGNNFLLCHFFLGKDDDDCDDDGDEGVGDEDDDDIYEKTFFPRPSL